MQEDSLTRENALCWWLLTSNSVSCVCSVWKQKLSLSNSSSYYTKLLKVNKIYLLEDSNSVFQLCIPYFVQQGLKTVCDPLWYQVVNFGPPSYKDSSYDIHTKNYGAFLMIFRNIISMKKIKPLLVDLGIPHLHLLLLGLN